MRTSKVLKQIMTFALLICIMFTAIACVQTDNTAKEDKQQSAQEQTKKDDSAKASGKTIRIALSTQLGHPYATALSEIAKKEAEIYGYQLDVLDTKGDVPTQINTLENAIASKYDAIIMQPYDGKALVPVAKKAFEAGIPVICAGMELEPEGMQYVATYIGSSGIAEGKAAAALAMKALGESGKVAMVEGAPGHPLVPQRGGEFEKLLAEKAPGIQIVAKDTGKWDRNVAMSVMENILTAHKDIDLVYAHDGGMAFGCIQAIEAAGLIDKIKVITINGNKEEYDAIRAGKLYGTVLNDASFIAINAVRCARDLLESRPILKEYISPADIITKENVDRYTAWW